MKKKIAEMARLYDRLNETNWQNKTELARFHKLGAEVAAELSDLTEPFVAMGMASVTAFHGKRFVEFLVENISPDGAGVQVNCNLDVIARSHPRPRGIKLPGLNYAPAAD